MSRRWKIATTVLFLIPLLAYLVVAGTIYRMVGSQYALGFVRGTLFGLQSRPLTSASFERTQARLSRGEYLTSVARCFSCHSETDPQTDLPIPGRVGAGTTRQLATTMVYPNITPDPGTGGRTWTDDMIARAIREGIGHDGRALAPIMPYQTFRYLSDEDVASIVVYLRSIPPVNNPLPKMRYPFPFNFVAKGFPRPLRGPVPSPDSSDRFKLGEYLTRIGNCADCHNATDRHGQLLPYAGGQMISDKGERKVAASNITPDPSGISYYDDGFFTRSIRTGHVGARELAAAMPWRYFRNFTDDDLKAIFSYLRRLAPAKHRVDNSEPLSYCKVCGQWHGGGKLN